MQQGFLTSKITSKSQTTLPKAVRDRLQVQPGDALVYTFEGDSVRIQKATALDIAWHSAISNTLEEWNTPEDDEAFRNL
jgi:antitoxin PrlF